MFVHQHPIIVSHSDSCKEYYTAMCYLPVNEYTEINQMYFFVCQTGRRNVKCYLISYLI